MKEILNSTPEFDKEDVSTCMECLQEYFNGKQTYKFICAREGDRIAGFASYGSDSIAEDLFELYWIVVVPENRGKRIGQLLQSYIEGEMQQEGVRMIVAETESDPSYSSARKFYEKCGYTQEASIRDFYNKKSDKIIYVKRIGKEETMDWRGLIAKSINRPGDLPERCRPKRGEIKGVVNVFPMRVNPYYASLIEREGDPIWRQCIPDKLELEDFGVEDPLNEEGDSPVPGLVHRYPDRVLLLVSNQCAMYCRFCTRKRRVGDPLKEITMNQILKGIDYIKENSQIRDVILSGGDPFMLNDSFLEVIIKELRSIPHIQIIRIGTRVPCTLPQRITDELCTMLKKYHPIYVNTHFNHPREITQESRKACGMLADAGIPLGCQTVLLKGVNDDPAVIKELMQKLVEMRVKPYYLYQCDLARGNEHFRTPLEVGLNVIENLRGHTSGLCAPQFVIDAPGGGGKIPIQPDYLVKKTKNKLTLRNYRGDVFEYTEPIFIKVENKKMVNEIKKCVKQDMGDGNENE
ncbi:MAG: KamA family radical SAM protein [Methanobacteriota archaeon]